MGDTDRLQHIKNAMLCNDKDGIRFHVSALLQQVALAAAAYSGFMSWISILSRPDLINLVSSSLDFGTEDKLSLGGSDDDLLECLAWMLYYPSTQNVTSQLQWLIPSQFVGADCNVAGSIQLKMAELHRGIEAAVRPYEGNKNKYKVQRAYILRSYMKSLISTVGGKKALPLLMDPSLRKIRPGKSSDQHLEEEKQCFPFGSGAALYYIFGYSGQLTELKEADKEDGYIRRPPLVTAPEIIAILFQIEKDLEQQNKPLTVSITVVKHAIKRLRLEGKIVDRPVGVEEEESSSDEDASLDEDLSDTETMDGEERNKKKRGKKKSPKKSTKKKTKKDPTDRFEPPSLERLTSHGFLPGATIVNHQASCLEKTASSLGIVEFTKYYNEKVAAPFDLGLECGPSCRVKLGLPATSDRFEFKAMEIVNHPLLELDDKKKANNKKKNVVVLTAFVQHLKNHLSDEFRDAFLLKLNQQRWCRATKKGGETSYRTFVLPGHGKNYFKVGHNGAIIADDACVAEEVIAMLWEEYINRVNLCSNGQMRRIAHLQEDNDMDLWKRGLRLRGTDATEALGADDTIVSAATIHEAGKELVLSFDVEEEEEVLSFDEEEKDDNEEVDRQRVAPSNSGEDEEVSELSESHSEKELQPIVGAGDDEDDGAGDDEDDGAAGTGGTGNGGGSGMQQFEARIGREQHETRIRMQQLRDEYRQLSQEDLQHALENEGNAERGVVLEQEHQRRRILAQQQQQQQQQQAQQAAPSADDATSVKENADDASSVEEEVQDSDEDDTLPDEDDESDGGSEWTDDEKDGDISLIPIRGGGPGSVDCPDTFMQDFDVCCSIYEGQAAQQGGPSIVSTEVELPQWRRGFLSTASTQHVGARPLEGTRRDFYKEMQVASRLYPGQPLVYSPFEYTPIDGGIAGAGVGADYGVHSDDDNGNSSTDKKNPKVCTHGTLPYSYQMCVGTSTLGLAPANVDTYLWHGYLDEAGKKNPLSRLKTRNSDGHCQFQMVQDSAKHWSKAVTAPAAIRASTGAKKYVPLVFPELVPEDATPLDARTTVTLRTLPCPEKDSEVYSEGIVSDDLTPDDLDRREGFKLYNGYNHTNPFFGRKEFLHPDGSAVRPLEDWHRQKPPEFWKLRDKEEEGGSDGELVGIETVELPTPPTLNKMPKWLWDRLHYETFDMNSVFDPAQDGSTPKLGLPKTMRGIGLPTRFVQAPQTLGGLAMNRKATEILVKARRRLVILQEDGTFRGPNPLFVHPEHGLPPAMGQIVSGDVMSLKFNARHKAIIHIIFRDQQSLQHIYKNDAPSVDKVILFCKEIFQWRSSKEFDKTSHKDKQKEAAFRARYQVLFMESNGSGGSSQQQGANGLSAAKASPDDAHYIGGPGQKHYTSENIAFIDCVEDGNAITVVVNLTNWMKPKRKTDSTGLGKEKRKERNSDKEDATNSNSNEVEEEEEVEDEDENDEARDEEEDALDTYEDGAGIGDSKEEKDGGGKADEEDVYMVLGQWTAVDLRRRTKTIDELEIQYENFPDYLSKNAYDLSHHRVGSYSLGLKPSFAFDTMLQIMDDNLGCVPAYSEHVVQDAGRKIQVPLDKLAEKLANDNVIDEREQAALNRIFAEAKDPQTQNGDGEGKDPQTQNEEGQGKARNHPMPPAWLRTEEILHWYHNDPDLLLKDLDTQEISTAKLTETLAQQYSITTSQLVPMSVAIMGVAGERIQREVSTKSLEPQTKKETKPKKRKETEPPPPPPPPPPEFIVSLPLIGNGMEEYPDPLRERPAPCSNPDADPSRRFPASQAHLLYQEWKERQGRGEKDLPVPELKPKEGCLLDGIYEVPDFTQPGACEFVAEALLMSLFSRFTGKVAVLETMAKFNEELEKKQEGKSQRKFTSKVCLPTTTTVSYAIAFLQAHKRKYKHMLSHFMTAQHAGAVHKKFKKGTKGVDSFCKFMKDFATEDHGIARVVGYLKSATDEEKEGGGIVRVELRDLLAKGVADCSPLKAGGKDLSFILHHNIADVESMIPGFAGEVTLDSVGLGFGSTFGIKILTKHITTRMKAIDRLQLIHNEFFQDLLATIKTDPHGGHTCHHLEAMGYTYDPEQKKIFSLFNGREFSLTDTEHVCCKLYVVIAISGPTRTGSEQPCAHNSHCWPLPCDYSWVEPIQRCFRKMKEAYQKLPRDYLFQNYPAQLKYRVPFYLVDPARAPCFT